MAPGAVDAGEGERQPRCQQQHQRGEAGRHAEPKVEVGVLEAEGLEGPGCISLVDRESGDREDRPDARQREAELARVDPSGCLKRELFHRAGVITGSSLLGGNFFNIVEISGMCATSYTPNLRVESRTEPQPPGPLDSKTGMAGEILRLFIELWRYDLPAKYSALIWMYFSHSEGSWSSAKQASTGHASTQASQSMHSSGSMCSNSTAS